jgi:hypothetical protein
MRRRRSVTVAALAAAAITALLLPLSGSAKPQATPTNTSPPTISGSPVRGQTLVGGTGSWAGTAPISFGFQWQRCVGADNCAQIQGAASTTYVVTSTDVGTRIRLQVSATNPEGTARAWSNQTAVVTEGGTPKNTSEPRISGTAFVGQRLTVTPGSWTGAPPLSLRYQWVRCGADGGRPDAGNCALIPGATTTTYVLTAADVGARIRVRVTATNPAGSSMVATNPTGTVRASAPVNSGPPIVSGSMVEGQTAAVSTGTWSGAAPITFGYQWLRCNNAGGGCVVIAGATASRYRLTSADVGHRIRVNVTARNPGGSRTVMSGESAIVVAAGPAGIITLPTGEKSIPVTSVPKTERLIVDRVIFTPTVVNSRLDVIGVQVRVKDTRGYVVRDAMVFIRSTPLVTRAGQSRRPTLATGYAVFQMSPRATFPTKRRGAVQFFVKAYKTGDHPLAGIAGYRLVQVRLAR